MKRPGSPTRSARELLASTSGRWLALFSLGVGISLTWTYVPLFLAPLGIGMGATLFDDPLITVAYFAVCALTFAVFALVNWAGKQGDADGSSRPPDAHSARLRAAALSGFGLPHALVGVAGGILLAINTLLPGSVPTLVAGCIGAALAAFANACAIITASRLLKRLSPARAIVACTGAFLVTAVITTVAAFVTGPVAACLVALAPLATLALGRASDSRIPFADLARGGEKSLTLVPFRPEEAWRYGAITLGLFMMGGWLLNNAGQYNHLPADMPLWLTILISTLAVATFAGVATLLQSSTKALGYDLICRICVPTIAVSILLAFLPENNAGVLDVIAVCLTFVGLLTSELMVWVIDVCAMRGRGAASERAFSLMRAMMCVGVIAATAVVHGVKWAPLDKPKVAMAIGFLMLIVTIVCLPAAGAKVLPITGTQPAPLRGLSDAKRERWSETIVKRGLTAREAEVFILLMDDLDPADIAAELGVSAATVHTHVQHVYTKFAVHSRKDLERAAKTKA